MITSPYDGLSRAPLRVGLAAVSVADALGLAAQIQQTAPNDLSYPAAPGFLLALHDHSLARGGVTAIAIMCSVSFGRGRAVIASGLGALAALGLLSESHAALVGEPARNFYTAGAMMLGWVFGLVYARGLKDRGLRLPAPDEERLAEFGAIGALAASYVGAGVSKLLRGSFAEVNHLRGMVVSQHPVGDASPLGLYARAVAEHGSLSQALSILTLVVQLSAFLLVVSPTLRRASTLGIVGFHLNVLFLAHILYIEALFLVLLFGLPWPTIVARLLGRPAANRPVPDLAPYGRPAPAELAPEARALLGGLRVGAGRLARARRRRRDERPAEMTRPGAALEHARDEAARGE